MYSLNILNRRIEANAAHQDQQITLASNPSVNKHGHLR